MVPVYTDKETERAQADTSGAGEQLLRLFRQDASDSYTRLMQDFANLSTLQERMDRESIACEYISREQGWCQARFFAMDREEGQPLQRVLFTIQNINDEKLEMSRIEERITRSEMERSVKNSVFNSMYHDISVPLHTILALTEKISRQSSEAPVRGYAGEITQEGERLLTLIHKMLDASRFAGGLTEIHAEAFSMKELLLEVYRSASDALAGRPVDLITDVSPAIVDCLQGDRAKLRQILDYLLSNAARFTQSGTIKLSVFGKAADGHEHLLISVRDTGVGIEQAQCREMTQHWLSAGKNGGHEMEGAGLGLNLVNDVLGLMGSGLQLISVPGEGSEFYFELDLETAGSTLIGQIDFSAVR